VLDVDVMVTDPMQDTMALNVISQPTNVAVEFNAIFS
jgi:hypothetical protein